MSVPDLIDDYNFSLTTPGGVVYTAQRYPWTERDFYLNIDWGYNRFTKPDSELTMSDREYVFDKTFFTSLHYTRVLPAESTHIAFTLYKVDGTNLGFTQVTTYVNEDGVREITEVDEVIDKAFRGQGHSKYINAMLQHSGRYFIPTYSKAVVKIRHGNLAARKRWQDDEALLSSGAEKTIEYNDIVGEHTQTSHWLPQPQMTAVYERNDTLGTWSTTDPDVYWSKSPKTDAKWAHPLNSTTPDFSV